MNDLQTYLKEVRERVDAAKTPPFNGDADLKFIEKCCTDIPRLLAMLDYANSIISSFKIRCHNEKKTVEMYRHYVKTLNDIARGEHE